MYVDKCKTLTCNQLSPFYHHHCPAVVFFQCLLRNPLLRCASYEPRPQLRKTLSPDAKLLKHLSLPLPPKMKITTATHNKKPAAMPPSAPTSPVSNRSSGFSSIGSADERWQRYVALFDDVEDINKAPKVK
ncbi:uncharacterized protein LOC118742804 [Rhagoletis pomonella]|uniref:uncharacterized protein LOC118742804 n=1 Tax=Rhagoletis pomonella TaxID=28610 RepID=UPI001780844D|nr:uncharacterized protein LOC118742804 [Rhagoletis pomonella]